MDKETAGTASKKKISIGTFALNVFCIISSIYNGIIFVKYFYLQNCLLLIISVATAVVTNLRFKKRSPKDGIIILLFLYYFVLGTNWIINPLNAFRPLYTYKYYYNDILDKDIFPEAIPKGSVFRYYSPTVQFNGGAAVYIKSYDRDTLSSYIPDKEIIEKDDDKDMLELELRLISYDLTEEFEGGEICYFNRSPEKHEGYIISDDSIIIFSV